MPGGQQRSNLTRSKRAGFKSLKERIKNISLIVCMSDKTGKFVVMSPEAYLRMGAPHVASDREVNKEYIEETQKIVNGHTAAHLKIMGDGEKWGQ